MFISENKGFSLVVISYFGDDMITLLLAKIFICIYYVCKLIFVTLALTLVNSCEVKMP